MSKWIQFFKLVLVVPLAIGIASFASVISGELLDDYYSTGPWVVVNVEGDKDGFGLGMEEGDVRPAGSSIFDEREIGDPNFTDVWPIPWTDPTDFSFTYTHTFDPPEGSFIAKLKIFSLGIQDGDSQVSTSDTDIKLYADGIEVPDAFDSVDQFFWADGIGWVEVAGYVEMEIPPEIAHVLSDGSVELTYEVLQLGSHVGTDGFAIDFSEIVIEPSIPTRMEILATTVIVLNLPAGLETAMLATLDEAFDLLEDPISDNDIAAVNKLSAILNKVDAQRGKKISESEADYIAGQVMDIVSALVGDERCPCWTYSDMYSLPIEGTSAACVTDSTSRLDIVQEGICEHTYGVTVNRLDGSLDCVANRFGCPGLSDLGGEFFDTSETEFYVCLGQIILRCEDLGIIPPEFP